MVEIIIIIINSIYTPLVLALNEIPMLAVIINNGYLMVSISEIIATLATLFVFGYLLLFPLLLVYWVILGVKRRY